jgi:hypothetical protein
MFPQSANDFPGMFCPAVDWGQFVLYVEKGVSLLQSRAATHVIQPEEEER